MFKVEFYKLTHSKNLLYLLFVVVPVALYLGFSMIVQMKITSIEDALHVAFVRSSAVLMLYFSVHSIMFLNRDYRTNIFRVLVSIGMSRQRIMLAKYILFIISGFLILFIHVLMATIFIIIHTKQWLNQYILSESILFLFPYLAILSIMFLLSVVGRTTIKTLVFNIAFIILSGVLIQPLHNAVPILPIQAMQTIAERKTEYNLIIILLSLVYSVASCIGSMVVFEKQEL